MSQSITRMKAHFDYNPKTDQHLPCPEAGLAFNRGAVLFILNQDDPDWWQVSKVRELKYSLVFLFRLSMMEGAKTSEQG